MITLSCIIGLIVLILWEKGQEHYVSYKVKKVNKEYLSQFIENRHNDEPKI